MMNGYLDQSEDATREMYRKIGEVMGIKKMKKPAVQLSPGMMPPGAIPMAPPPMPQAMPQNAPALPTMAGIGNSGDMGLENDVMSQMSKMFRQDFTNARP
jgi:hypothetical protein